MGKSSNWSLSSWFDNAYVQQLGAGNTFYTLTNPNLGNFLSVFTGGYSEANMVLLLQTLPELHFVVNAVAGRMMTGVYKLQDKDGNKVTDNALWNQIIKKPNWQYSFKGFGWHYEAYKLCTGNAYGYAYAPSTLKLKHSNIKALWLLPAHYVFIVMKEPRPSYLTTLSSRDYVNYYNYNGGYPTGQIPPEYVTHAIHMKMGDLTDIVTNKGVSPFKAAEKPLSNLVAVYEARNIIYVKRGPLGAIVSAAKDDGGSVPLTPGEKEEVMNDLTMRHGFGRDQSPLAFTNQPVNYVKFGANINELEPFKETEADTAALCAILGIPISLMPKGSEAKFANLDIAERNLYENVIFGEAEAFCDFLTECGHFDELGLKVVVDFSHITCLQDDALKNAQAFYYNAEAGTQLYNDGNITQNELRDRVQFSPIDGGDVYKEPVQQADNPPAIEPPIKGINKLFGNKKYKLKKFNFFNNGTS